MSKTRRLPTTLQLDFAERKCRKLNPDVDCEQIDFRAEIDDTLTYGENLSNLQENYPQFNWSEPEFTGPKSQEQSDVWEAESLVDPYSYGVKKKSAILKGERAVKRAKKLRTALKECEEAPPLPPKKKKRRKCEKTQWVEPHEVPGYWRCPAKK